MDSEPGVMMPPAERRFWGWNHVVSTVAAILLYLWLFPTVHDYVLDVMVELFDDGGEPTRGERVEDVMERLGLMYIALGGGVVFMLFFASAPRVEFQRDLLVVRSFRTRRIPWTDIADVLMQVPRHKFPLVPWWRLVFVQQNEKIVKTDLWFLPGSLATAVVAEARSWIEFHRAGQP